MRIVLPMIVFFSILAVFAGIQAAWRAWHRRQQRRRLRAFIESVPTPVSMSYTDTSRSSESRLLYGFADSARLEALLVAADVPTSPERFLTLVTALGLVVFVIAWIVFQHVLGGLLSMGIALGIPVLVLKIRQRRRDDALIRQVPDALEMIVRALRVGQSVDNALQEVAHSYPDPFGQEVRTIYEEVTLGIPFITALQHFEARFARLAEVKLMTTAFIIQRETGGNLTQVLANLSELIRQRDTLKRQVTAMTAESRSSAVILGGIALGCGFLVLDHSAYLYPGTLQPSHGPADADGRGSDGNHRVCGDAADDKDRTMNLPLIISSLVFLSVFYGFMSAYVYMEEKYWRAIIARRLLGNTQEAVEIITPRKTRWMEKAQRLGRSTVPKDPKALAGIQRRLSYASFRSPQAMAIYFGIRICGMLILGFLYLFFSLLTGHLGLVDAVMVFLPLAGGYYLPALLLQIRIRSRQRQIFHELPDALDLVLICLEAGLNFDLALFRVSRELAKVSPVMAEELGQYFLEVQSGLPRKTVLTNLAERNGVKSLDRRGGGSEPVHALRHQHRRGTAGTHPVHAHPTASTGRGRFRQDEHPPDLSHGAADSAGPFHRHPRPGPDQYLRKAQRWILMRLKILFITVVLGIVPAAMLAGCAGSARPTQPGMTLHAPKDQDLRDWKPETASPNHLILARDLVAARSLYRRHAAIDRCPERKRQGFRSLLPVGRVLS